MEITTPPAPSAKFEFDEFRIRSIKDHFSNPFKFRLMLAKILPMGFLSGMWIKVLTEERCEVMVRYKWLNKNPFRSTFWAVLGMAAEMSSGALLTMYTHGQKPSIATLVVHQEGRFMKKAVGKITFVCESGTAIKAAVQQTVESREPISIICPIVGFDEAGDMVAEFAFTWSFKVRLKK